MKKSPPRQTPSGLNGVYHFAIHTAGPVFCQRQTCGQSATPVRQSDEASIHMNFPCQGQWWLPGSPDKSVFGTLTFKYCRRSHKRIEGERAEPLLQNCVSHDLSFFQNAAFTPASYGTSKGMVNEGLAILCLVATI